MDKSYLTIDKASKKYNLSPYSIRRWIKDKLIEAYRESNIWYISEDSLLEFLKSKGIKVESAQDSNSLVTIIRLEEQIKSLEKLVKELEEERNFLRAQVQQLTNTINILTTKAIESPRQSLLQKIRGLFR